MDNFLVRRAAAVSVAVFVLCGGASAQGRGDDRIEEDVPGRPDLVKVTHIFRTPAVARARATAGCACPGPEGTNYSIERVKWFDPSFSISIYTSGSGVGSAAVTAITNAFGAWRAADPAAPSAIVAAQDFVSAPPPIALDDKQVISWQPLSATYGSSTLAVTVYWASRAKVNGFSKIVHFDMAFNTDYQWTLLGTTESCGGGTGAYDVQNVATHEAGHAYGMGHNNDCNLTMNPTAAAGETVKSTLAVGDISGIKSIY